MGTSIMGTATKPTDVGGKLIIARRRAADIAGAVSPLHDHTRGGGSGALFSRLRFVLTLLSAPGS